MLENQCRMWPLSLAAAVYVPLLDGLVYFSGTTELHRITEKQAVILLKEFHQRMQRKGTAHYVELLCELFFYWGGCCWRTLGACIRVGEGRFVVTCGTTKRGSCPQRLSASCVSIQSTWAVKQLSHCLTTCSALQPQKTAI